MNDEGQLIICEGCEQSSTKLRMQRNAEYIESNLKDMMTKCRLPARHFHAEIKSVKIPIKNIYNSMLFMGSKGLGKTYTMVALSKELIRRGETVRYITVPELMMELRASFTETENNEHKVIQRYLNADFLFLDDLGVEKPSEWVLQILFILIDRRYMDGKHICVSTNLGLDDIVKREDARIISRLVEMCDVIEFQGEDRRIS